MKTTLAAALLLLLAACASTPPAAPPAGPVIPVRPTADFEVDATGSNPAWAKTDWVALRKRQADGHPYETRFKILHSPAGLYLLMEGTDRKLTTTGKPDYHDLWTEDVFEAFFWTDERWPVYFEYEISPLGRELPILVPNFEGRIRGWRPWYWEKEPKIRKATAAIGGPKEAGAAVQGWRAEFFIPYALLVPLQNVPPRPGSTWRANFYRMDHDDGKRTQWDWAPVGPSFHEFQKFGTIRFEN
jgi:hypothetical protein